MPIEDKARRADYVIRTDGTLEDTERQVGSVCARLNARVQAEDEILTHSVQQGLASGAYTQGVLSDKEVVLAGFQDWIRERIPVARLVQAPPRGTVAARNSALRSAAGMTQGREG